MSIRAHTFAQRLSDRVHLERASRDSNTGDVTGWVRLASDVCAAVDGAKARGPERVVVDGTRSVGGYTVWLRADVVQRFALAVDDRVLWKTSVLDIKDVPDQGLQGRFIPMLCETGVNQG